MNTAVVSSLLTTTLNCCGCYKRQVGRTMFETSSVPADWVSRCNLMDEVRANRMHKDSSL